jgi:hypothetical protein
MDEQSRLTDLVPTRLPAFLIPLVLGTAVIAGLEALYAWMPQLARFATDGRVAAFDLDGEGSLAVWFSSMTLAAAGLVAIVVYTVRRHKVDDYHGRYRIWLWAASCWLLMSLDETASLHEGFKEMMATVSGTRLFGDGSVWWVVPYFFLLGAVGTRLLVDMRCCWLSSATLVLAALCYASAVAAQLGLVLHDGGAREVMFEEGAELFGDLLLLMAMGLHARHVILDAQGLLSSSRPRARRFGSREQQSQDDDSGELDGFHEVRVHPPHGIPRPIAPATQPLPRATATPPTSPPLAAKPSASFHATAASNLAAPVQRKLTRQERKALRKKLEKLRREREEQDR